MTGFTRRGLPPLVECLAPSLVAQRAKRLTEFFGMIEKVLFLAAVLLPGLAYCGDSSADQVARTPTQADLARTALGIIFSVATRYDTSRPVANRALSVSLPPAAAALPPCVDFERHVYRPAPFGIPHPDGLRHHHFVVLRRNEP
jgi:hypothetical protein